MILCFGGDMHPINMIKNVTLKNFSEMFIILANVYFLNYVLFSLKGVPEYIRNGLFSLLYAGTVL